MDERTQLLTPPQVAKQLGTSVHLVLSWIASKELLAINFARKGKTRPRWKVRQSDIDLFLLRRQSNPDVKAAPKKPKAKVVEFFK